MQIIILVVFTFFVGVHVGKKPADCTRECAECDESAADAGAAAAENQAETEYFKLYPEDRKLIENKENTK